jgi:hypothetical protein
MDIVAESVCGVSPHVPSCRAMYFAFLEGNEPGRF